MKQLVESIWSGQLKGKARPATAMKMSIGALPIEKRTKQVTENVQCLASKSLFTGDQKRANPQKVPLPGHLSQEKIRWWNMVLEQSDREEQNRWLSFKRHEGVANFKEQEFYQPFSQKKPVSKHCFDPGVSHNGVTQLSGHKSLKNVIYYAVALHQQQRQMSKILIGKTKTPTCNKSRHYQIICKTI